MATNPFLLPARVEGAPVTVGAPRFSLASGANDALQKARKATAALKKELKANTSARWQDSAMTAGAGVAVGHVAGPYLERLIQGEKPDPNSTLGKPGRANMVLALGGIAGSWYADGKQPALSDGLMSLAAFELGQWSAMTRSSGPTLKVSLPPGVTPTASPVAVIQYDKDGNRIGGMSERMERRQDRRAALVAGLADDGVTGDIVGLVDDAVSGVDDDTVGAGPLLLAPAALQALRGWLASITPAQAQQATGTTAAQAVVQGLGYDELGAVEARDVLTAESVSGREERKARRDKRRRERLAKQNAPKQIAQQGAKLDAVLEAVRSQGVQLQNLGNRLIQLETKQSLAPSAESSGEELIVEPV